MNDLCRGVRDGSSYMAFLLALHLEAQRVEEVIEAVGLPQDSTRTEVFDACVDGYSVWADARDRSLFAAAQND